MATCGSVAATDESLFSSNATSHGNAHIVSYPHRPWYPTALASTTHTTSRRARLACHGSNVTEKLYSRRSLDIHTEPAPFATAWHCGESGLGSLMQCCATAAAAHRSSSSRRRREWLCAKPILKGELGWAVRAADVFHEPQPVDAQAGAQWVWFGRRVRPASDREAAWRGCTVSRDAARRHASAHRLCPLAAALWLKRPWRRHSCRPAGAGCDKNSAICGTLRLGEAGALMRGRQRVPRCGHEAAIIRGLDARILRQPTARHDGTFARTVPKMTLALRQQRLELTARQWHGGEHDCATSKERCRNHVGLGSWRTRATSADRRCDRRRRLFPGRRNVTAAGIGTRRAHVRPARVDGSSMPKARSGRRMPSNG